MSEKKAATISDVAKAAGVSKTSVSRYLNGKYEFFSAATKEKIEKVIQELDYRPSQAARTLKTKRTGMIGCIVADIGSPFSSILVKGINDACTEKGYQLLIVNTDSSPEKEKAAVDSLRNSNVEGIIINATGYNSDYLVQVHKAGIPIVLADRGFPENILDTVATKNQEDTYNAVKQMYQIGFRHISLYIQSPFNISTRQQRIQGFIDAAKELCPKDEQNIVIVEPDNMEKTKSSLQAFESVNGPKGIFAGNGVVLLHVLQCMNQLNYRIPEDFGIAGYDDWDWPAIVNTGITTIKQDSYLMGKQCASILFSRINGLEGSPVFLELPTVLNVRGSTKL